MYCAGIIPKASGEVETEWEWGDETVTQDEIIGLILKSEGGLNENEPAHVGGVSYAGITQTTYDAWTGVKPVRNVRDLAAYPETVKSFYVDYLDKFHVWDLPECLQYIHADFSINAGAAAVRIVQEIVGVDADGVWGSGTTAAVKQWTVTFSEKQQSDPDTDNRIINEYHEAKLAHYRGLAERKPEVYAQYLTGWEKRSQHVLAQLSEYFQDELPKVRAIDEADVEEVTDDVPDLSEGADIQARSTERLLQDLESITEELRRRIHENDL